MTPPTPTPSPVTVIPAAWHDAVDAGHLRRIRELEQELRGAQMMFAALVAATAGITEPGDAEARMAKVPMKHLVDDLTLVSWPPRAPGDVYEYSVYRTRDLRAAETASPGGGVADA